MSKKLKILLTIVSALMLTLTGTFAVMANGEESTSDSDTLLAKAATILGDVTEQQLVDAFETAREQVASTAIETKLAEAVEDGTITADDKVTIEAWLAVRPDLSDEEAVAAWLEEKPEVLTDGTLGRFSGFSLRCKSYDCGIGSGEVMESVGVILDIDIETLTDAFQQAAAEIRTDRLSTDLAEAVESGNLTQDEADEIESWWSQRPAAVDEFMPGIGSGRGLGSGGGGCRGTR